MKILVVGVTGLLGNTVFRVFSGDAAHETWGTLRDHQALRNFPARLHGRLLSGISVLDHDALVAVLSKVKPEVVINCVGLVKQHADAKDPLAALPINAMLPHRLAQLCDLAGARLIHVSTDCVFSGRKGMYLEDDPSDAEDLYGKSKYIGELRDQQHAITLRTSIIGHEIRSRYALVDWFLSQSNSVRGFTNAIFSGLPTVELARVMKDIVIPRRDLNGLYHVAADPISKYALLRLIAAQYGHAVRITPDDTVVVDRSLDGSRFRAATGYVAPPWPQLVAGMHADYLMSQSRHV